MICPNCGVNLPNTAKMCYICKNVFPERNHNGTVQNAFSARQNNHQIPYNGSNRYVSQSKNKGIMKILLIAIIIGAFVGVIVYVSRPKRIGTYDNEIEEIEKRTENERITTEEKRATTEEEITTEVPVDDYSFSETVLYSDENIEVTLTSYSEDEGKPEFGMTIVNSSELDYEIFGFYTAINGIMQCGGTEEVSIAAGKTLNTKITFRNNEFEMGDYPTIYNVAIKMTLYSSDDTKIETDYKTFDIREGDYSNNNEVLYEDDNYVVYKVYVSDDLKENLLRIHNKKDYTVSVGLKDFSINDIMCDCDNSFSMSIGLSTYQILADIPPEYDTLVKITPYEEKLAENNITDIDSIEFKLEGHNASETVYIDDGSGDSDIIRIEK